MEQQQVAESTIANLGMFGMVMVGLLIIVGLISLISWIIVLVALFKKEGAGLGILGIVCNIYAFIWGWMKSKELGLKKTMIVWTLSIVAIIGLILVLVGGVAKIASSDPAIRKSMEVPERNQTELPAPQN